MYYSFPNKMEYSPKEIENIFFQNEITNLVFSRNIKESYKFSYDKISKPNKSIFMIKINGHLLWFHFILFLSLVELFVYCIFFLYGKFGIIGIIGFKKQKMKFKNKNSTYIIYNYNKNNISQKGLKVNSLLLEYDIYKKIIKMVV